MGIYATTNGPLFGMCFPAECTADNINGMSKPKIVLLHLIADNYALVMERFNSHEAAPENSTRYISTCKTQS